MLNTMSEENQVESQESQESQNEDQSLCESKTVDPIDSEPVRETNDLSSDSPSESVSTNSSAESKIPSDIDISSTTSPKADNEARLEQLEKEHEMLRSQYMRIAADFDNFRKRQTRDQDDLRLQLTCNTLSTILPVVDNFERARQQLEPEGEEAKALHRSYQGLYKQLVEVLKQLGVAPMRVVGQAFDPTLHEAVSREPSEEKSEDIVIEELQRGYHLNGRVLRHALVKVSMGPGPTKNQPESTGEVLDNPVQESIPDDPESALNKD
tara:strand:- start:144 stop:944 length:801 start_codon:yes stop_codon:yes gene_type:complete